MQTRKEEKIYLKILTNSIYLCFALFTFLKAGDLEITNRQNISNDSMVYGNSAVIINGKVPRSSKSSKSSSLREVKIPPRVKSLTITSDGVKVDVYHQRKESYITVLDGVKVEQNSNKNIIVNDKNFDDKIALHVEEIATLRLLGDSELSYSVEQKRLELFSDGDLSADVHDVKTLIVTSKGDVELSLHGVKKLNLYFEGDVTLRFDKDLKSLFLKGKGDVEVVTNRQNFVSKVQIQGDYHTSTP